MIIVLQSYSFFTTFAIVIIVFCCVSPYLANHVLQVSQIRVGQGFANTRFAVLHLLRKISNVSQYEFRKVLQFSVSQEFV